MNSSETIKKRNLKKTKNKAILLGITGGIAAYKTVDLVRRLKDEDYSVNVILTEAASKFVSQLSLEIVSGNKVLQSLFEHPMAHIELPSNADLFLIAPATANIISKFANGIADDLLSTSLLSFRGKVIIAPSMNWRMYENSIIQENLVRLKKRDVIQVGPEKGKLACGEEGNGRMADIHEIVETVRYALTEKDLLGKKIVVTAGPTREYIDPVRFISNRSSGKMGYAIARSANARGAEVILISGPTYLRPPAGLNPVYVETSSEMLDAVIKEADNADVLIMAAAVSDFAPVNSSLVKIDKHDILSVDLKKTEDIISLIGKRKNRPFIIGFAAETGKKIERAEKKMRNKNMDMIVFNDVTEEGAGFEVDTNKVTIIDRLGRTSLDIMSKESIAEAILDRMVEINA